MQTTRLSTSAKALERRVRTLAMDLGWTWCPAAKRAFAALDPREWEATKHAPLTTLQRMHPARLEACATDPAVLALFDEAERAREARLGTKAWFTRRHRGADARLRVAYFCSEYALHESLPQYSGGLGVLAGDHVKSASDLGIPFVGVGLLYQHGYYIQELQGDGSTRALYPRYDSSQLPLVDTGKEILCPLGRGEVRARIWRLQVGRVPLYLLDTDLPGAPRAHRGRDPRHERRPPRESPFPQLGPPRTARDRALSSCPRGRGRGGEDLQHRRPVRLVGGDRR